MPSLWQDKLRELLCDLYQLLGGNCQDLGAIPAAQIAAVSAGYAPVIPPQSQWPQTNTILDQLAGHQALPGNTLSPSDNEALNNLIAMIRTKVN